MKKITLFLLALMSLPWVAHATMLNCSQTVGNKKIQQGTFFPGNVIVPFESGKSTDENTSLAMNPILDEYLNLSADKNDLRPFLQIRLVRDGISSSIQGRVINVHERLTVLKSEIKGVNLSSAASSSDYSIPEGVRLNLDPAQIKGKSKVALNFSIQMEDQSQRTIQCEISN